MLNRRSLLIAAALAAASASAIAPQARAAATVPFSAPAFSTALEQGGPILIAVTAPWCPTCKAQKQVLTDLEAAGKHQAMQIFEVDFDSQKDILRQFGVQQQSTLIVFKAGKEVGRAVGQTSSAAIEDLLNKTL